MPLTQFRITLSAAAAACFGDARAGNLPVFAQFHILVRQKLASTRRERLNMKMTAMLDRVSLLKLRHKVPWVINGKSGDVDLHPCPREGRVLHNTSNRLQDLSPRWRFQYRLNSTSTIS